MKTHAFMYLSATQRARCSCSADVVATAKPLIHHLIRVVLLDKTMGNNSFEGILDFVLYASVGYMYNSKLCDLLLGSGTKWWDKVIFVSAQIKTKKSPRVADRFE